jgi:hypothetical protein
LTGEAFGLVGLDAGYLIAGTALLWGLGFVRRPADLLRYAPLGLAVGWVSTVVLATYLLLIGPMSTVPETIAIWAALVGVSMLLAQRVPAWPSRSRREASPSGWAVTGAGVLVLVAVLGAQLRRALASGAFPPDAVSSWIPKAEALFYFGHIDSKPGGYLSMGFADYPPFQYVSDALSFRFMGAGDPLLLPAQHWVIGAAFLLSIGSLLASRVRPAVLWPCVAAVAVIPQFDELIGSSLADEPLAELLALAGVCAVLWLLERDRRLPALFALFSAGGVLVKSEGLALMLVLAAVPLVLTLRRRLWVEAALVAAGVLAFVPWRVWIAVHHIVRLSPDYRLSNIFHFGYLGDHASRLETALGPYTKALFSPSQTLLLAALALGLAVVLAPRRPAVSLLVGLAVVVPSLVYLAIYWIAFVEIHFYLDSTVHRITAPIAVLCGALVPLLLTEVWAAPRETSG